VHMHAAQQFVSTCSSTREKKWEHIPATRSG
jgi:hypothetical protein